MCHQEIRDILLCKALSFRWSHTSYFFPTCSKLKTCLGNYFSERCKSLLSHPRLPSLTVGLFPHYPKLVSWAMLLKDLFKLYNAIYCRRNHTAGLSRKADAGHLALPSFSTATTRCISPNRHLCEAALGAWGWFVVYCSGPAICHTTVIFFQLPLVSFLQQQQKTPVFQVWQTIHLQKHKNFREW